MTNERRDYILKWLSKGVIHLDKLYEGNFPIMNKHELNFARKHLSDMLSESFTSHHFHAIESLNKINKQIDTKPFLDRIALFPELNEVGKSQLLQWLDFNGTDKFDEMIHEQVMQDQRDSLAENKAVSESTELPSLGQLGKQIDINFQRQTNVRIGIAIKELQIKEIRELSNKKKYPRELREKFGIENGNNN